MGTTVLELFERAAYYGFLMVLTLYLTNIVGYNDKETGFIGGVFFVGLYLLPLFIFRHVTNWMDRASQLPA